MAKAKEEDEGQPDPLEAIRTHAGVLTELAYLASSKLPSEGLFDNAAVLIGKALEVDHIKIMRYRPNEGDLLMVAGTGWREGVVGSATFSADMGSAAGRAFQTGQPMVIDDLAKADGIRPSAMLVEHGIRSVLNAPLQIDGAAWGVIEADSIRAGIFGEDTQNFLMTSAWIIAASVRREQVARAQADAIADAAEVGRRNAILLQEMHHRVKNNFQMILALVSIQSGRVKGPESREALNKVSDGIIAMSLAHGQLSPTRQGEAVRLPTYLGALATQIQKSLEVITIELEAEDISVPIEKAVPLGLVLNELVTNAVKHAYGDDGGLIKVMLGTGPGKGEATLSVADQGRGLSAAKEGGSGLRLIEALARQVRGRVEQDSSDKGLTVRLSFFLD